MEVVRARMLQSLIDRGAEIRAYKLSQGGMSMKKKRPGQEDEIPTSDMADMLRDISFAAAPLLAFDEEELVCTKCVRFVGRWGAHGGRGAQQLAMDAGAAEWVLRGVPTCQALLVGRLAFAAACAEAAAAQQVVLEAAQHEMRECGEAMEDVASQELFLAAQKAFMKAEKHLDGSKEAADALDGEEEDAWAAAEVMKEELEAVCRGAGQLVSRCVGAKELALSLDLPGTLMSLAKQGEWEAVRGAAIGAVGLLAAGHEGLQDRLRERGAVGLFLRQLRSELRPLEDETESEEAVHYWGAQMCHVATTLCQLTESNPQSAKHVRLMTGEEADGAVAGAPKKKEAEAEEEKKEEEEEEEGKEEEGKESMWEDSEDEGDDEDDDGTLTGFEMLASGLLDKRLRDSQFEDSALTRLMLLRTIAACSEPVIETLVRLPPAHGAGTAHGDDGGGGGRPPAAAAAEQEQEQVRELVSESKLADALHEQAGGGGVLSAKSKWHMVQASGVRLVMANCDPRCTTRALYAEVAAVPCRHPALRRALRYQVKMPRSPP